MANAEDNKRNRRAKFVELANKRVTRTLNDIRLIGNLSNKSAYDYTDEDVKKIVRALSRELDQMKSKFTGSDGGGDASFSL